MKNMEANECVSKSVENQCAQESVAPIGTASPELDLPRERRKHKPWEAADLEDRGMAEQGRAVVERIPRRWDRFVRLVGEDALSLIHI